jgi:steroid 5-alpha reductase family enzyme
MSILWDNMLLIWGMMTIMWVISVWQKDASLIDLIWGAGFVFIAWLTAFCTLGHLGANLIELDHIQGLIFLLMVTLWGLRLSLYLAWRNLGHGEDRRYVEMRKKAGAWFPVLSYVTVYLLQGVIMFVVALPIQMGLPTLFDSGTSALMTLQISGILCWMIGLTFEAVGDLQLAQFKSKPEHKGQVMDRGLWRYTRHPNYFGDFMVWWGIWLFAASSQQHLWTVISPIIMSVFLMKISGVTLLESHLKESKPGYAEYQRKTNAFFPWFPRR